jgi:hypothetical protein
MLYAAALLGECKEAAAVSRLVTGPVDRNTRIVTITSDFWMTEAHC